MTTFMLQKKILKTIYFRNCGDHSEDNFVKNQLLLELEPNAYELLKLVLWSINNLQDFSNKLNSFEYPLGETRGGKLNLMKEIFRKKGLNGIQKSTGDLEFSVCLRQAKKD